MSNGAGNQPEKEDKSKDRGPVLDTLAWLIDDRNMALKMAGLVCVLVSSWISLANSQLESAAAERKAAQEAAQRLVDSAAEVAKEERIQHREDMKEAHRVAEKRWEVVQQNSETSRQNTEAVKQMTSELRRACDWLEKSHKSTLGKQK